MTAEAVQLRVQCLTCWWPQVLWVSPSVSGSRQSVSLLNPKSCEWGGSQPRMSFPGLGRGQDWSAATFPLSSRATAPSLYLRSPDNIRGALGPLGQAHPLYHMRRMKTHCQITLTGNNRIFFFSWSWRTYRGRNSEIIFQHSSLRALESTNSVF